MERVQIELRPWTQRPLSTDTVRRQSSAQLGCGPVLLALGLLGLAGAVLDHQTQFWFGGPFLVVVGAVLLWNGLRLRRAVRHRDGDSLALAAPYAFALEGDDVVLPAGGTWDEERWPLAATRFSVGRRLGEEALVLECQGRRRRSFPAAGLVESPPRVLQVVEEYRARR